jgi:type III secretion protein L
MMIWLREPAVAAAEEGRWLGVGTDGDIVPREALAHLVELDDGYLALQNKHAEILANAHAEAAAIVAAAAGDAAALRQQSQREFDSAHERGFEAGRLEAAAQWYARTVELLAQRRELQMSLRNRIAGLVVSAVEKIVVSEEPAALFARAATAVERIIDGSSHLQIRVNPEAHDAAAQAFARAAAGWREHGRPVQITVTADRSLEPGACVCETDIGSIDASLAVQIDAVRSAVGTALRRALARDDLADEESSAGEPETPGGNVAGLSVQSPGLAMQEQAEPDLALSSALAPDSTRVVEGALAAECA